MLKCFALLELILNKFLLCLSNLLAIYVRLQQDSLFSLIAAVHNIDQACVKFLTCHQITLDFSTASYYS
jgi:hypothetical protein